MGGLLVSQVHAPEPGKATGPLNYTLNAWYPSLYEPKTPAPDPGTDPSTPGSGNDYLQATCDGDVLVGMIVMANPSTQGGIVLQPATSDSPQAALGIVVAKATTNQCTVQTDGIVTHGIAGLIPGANYYVGQNGALRLPPLDGVVFAQLVGQAASETTLNLSNNGQVFKREVLDDAPQGQG